MSNNDDFDFNRDDLFDDFGDDDSGGDDFGSDDFDFGDDSDDFNLDDDDFGNDLDSALGGDDDDFGGDGGDDFATTENTGGGGTSRGFVIAAIAMVVLFLLGIGLIVFILLRPNQADLDFFASATAISLTNEVSLTQISASETAAIDNATATEAANIANATATEQAIIDATASFVPPTETPTEDFTATAIQLTVDAQNAQATVDAQFEIDATNTEIAFQLTLNPSFVPPTQEIIPTETPEGQVEETAEAPQGGTPVSLNAVQQTATALAELFAATPTTSGGGVQATDILLGGTPIASGGGTPTGTTTSGQGGGGDGQLPNTGLFDEVFQGNPTFIFLAAFGLLGVIVFSRSVRSRKKHDD